jgi:small-conductance mechanosensitive channel/CRP-like cAMP-binding protein
MSPAGRSSLILYQEILVVFSFFLIGFIIYAGIKKLLRKKTDESAFGFFMARLNFAVVFLMLALILKIDKVRAAILRSEKLKIYLDAALVFFFIVFLIRLIDAVFRFIYKKRKITLPIPGVLHGMILAIIYILVLFIIMKDILGISLTGVLATSAVLTMILGLAFQGVLSNILSGISIHLTRAFTKGDWVEIASHEGVVIDTNWRETRIRDRLSNIIVIPNNMVASEKITNFSLPNAKTALKIPVKVGYDASPSDVFDALNEAARDVPAVLKDPAPEVQLHDYDDLGVSYVIKFWIKDYEHKYPVMAEVGRKIWYRFQRNNIHIPIPIGDKLKEVLLSVNKENRAAVLRQAVEKNYEDLIGSSFLKDIDEKGRERLLVSESEIMELAEGVARHRFAPGEIIFKQGDRGDSCFIVAKGKIHGEIEYQEKRKKYKNEFDVGPGGIFGEMSLFTGMPRTATGIVLEEAELLEIKKEAFAELLGKTPNLADAIAEIVSKRNQENQEFLKKIKELSKEDIEQSMNKKSILKFLKGLLGTRRRRPS